jgi:hypothetical protein
MLRALVGAKYDDLDPAVVVYLDDILKVMTNRNSFMSVHPMLAQTHILDFRMLQAIVRNGMIFFNLAVILCPTGIYRSQILTLFWKIF